jgi:hypothetical protein
VRAEIVEATAGSFTGHAAWHLIAPIGITSPRPFDSLKYDAFGNDVPVHVLSDPIFAIKMTMHCT